ncbi:hypothetical protein NP493_159g00008 [Ridgeia piscesae]|uniref:Core-binding factor subunit beta n=1 Tax=Ridgeia piscesae TaxID=27915 RepID=A0AAD9UFR6_RIDPI|nr:hypothetical protein NP493_159g00008 [Ridgeia piscesae]
MLIAPPTRSPTTWSGINLQLAFVSNAWSEAEEDRIATQEFVDFQRERGKVHLKSQFIMNGVSVIWRGWIDLQRLDGAGWLEFDEERARVEDQILREQIEQYNRHLHGIDDQQRHLQEEREQRAEVEAEVAEALLHFSGNMHNNNNYHK